MSASSAAASMPPNMTEAGAFPQHPSDVLIDLVAALLTPMFLGTSRGDPRLARLAALETVHAYQVSTQADLVSVLQIVALGLAAAHAACLSMTPDLPLPQVMRLFGYADRLNRSGIARGKYRQEERRQPQAARREAQEKKAAPPPAPKPTAAAPESRSASPTAAKPIQPNQAPSWTAAIAQLTEMLTPVAGFDPIAQRALARQEATLRAKALNGVAHHLMGGAAIPEASFRLPPAGNSR